MTMRPRDVPEDARVPIDITLLVYLAYREDPVDVIVTYEIPVAVLSDDDTLHDVMQVALQNILSTIDVVREHRLILSDRNLNKFIFLVDHIQGVSMLAPSEDTLRNALEKL